MARRRKRGRSSANWMTEEYGGMPVWGLLSAVVVLVVVGVVALVGAMQQPVSADPNRQMEPAPTFTFAAEDDEDRPARVLFIGDSYSSGAGASAAAARWTSVASTQLGWFEINKALGGTGYLATAGRNGCGQDYCATFGEVINAQTDVDPEIVVISGGRNDGDRADFGAAVANTIAAAQAKWPEARLVVTSPLWDDGTPPAWIGTHIEAVRDAATAAGATFLDLGQPLAGHTDWLAEDGVHPNDAGYGSIAAAFVAAWNAANPTP